MSKDIFQEIREYVHKFQSGNVSMTDSSQLLASCFFLEIKVFRG